MLGFAPLREPIGYLTFRRILGTGLDADGDAVTRRVVATGDLMIFAVLRFMLFVCFPSIESPLQTLAFCLYLCKWVLQGVGGKL